MSFRLGVSRREDAEIEGEVVVEEEVATTAAPIASPITLTELGDADVVEDDDWVTLIDDGETFRYLCSEVVADNDPTVVPLAFFMDLAFPEGAEELALRHVQEQLVTSIAGQYGVSDGTGCENPTTGRTWLVEISSNLSDWVRDPALGEGKSLLYCLVGFVFLRSCPHPCLTLLWLLLNNRYLLFHD
jgi:hypothetical protein